MISEPRRISSGLGPAQIWGLPVTKNEPAAIKATLLKVGARDNLFPVEILDAAS